MAVKQEVQVVALDQILENWVRQYQFPENVQLVHHDATVDTAKNRVVLLLTVNVEPVPEQEQVEAPFDYS